MPRRRLYGRGFVQHFIIAAKLSDAPVELCLVPFIVIKEVHRNVIDGQLEKCVMISGIGILGSPKRGNAFPGCQATYEVNLLSCLYVVELKAPKVLWLLTREDGLARDDGLDGMFRVGAASDRNAKPINLARLALQLVRVQEDE